MNTIQGHLSLTDGSTREVDLGPHLCCRGVPGLRLESAEGALTSGVRGDRPRTASVWT